MSDRHAFRAKWHDYNGGIYFVTICAADKKHIFGKIISDKAVGTRFIASALGNIVNENILKIPSHYDNVEIWNHVVMPNHVHIVIAVGRQQVSSEQTSTQNAGCIKPPRHGEPSADNHHNSRLSTIVGAFKAGVTRAVRTRLIEGNCENDTARTRLIASLPIWQSRYHEHVIRNKRAYDNIMEYINTNPERWSKDCFNDENISKWID